MPRQTWGRGDGETRGGSFSRWASRNPFQPLQKTREYVVAQVRRVLKFVMSTACHLCWMMYAFPSVGGPLLKNLNREGLKGNA